MLSTAFLVLAAAFFPYALAQTTAPGVIPTTAPSSTASAVTTPTAAPTLVLPAIGTVQACGTARLNWQLLNVNANPYTVTFRAHNSGVDQAITRSTTSSAAATTIPPSSAPPTSSATTTIPPVAALPGIAVPITTRPVVAATTPTSSSPIDDVLGIARRSPIKRTTLSINQTMGSNPAIVGYSMPVNLPEGRYILVASIPQLGISSSVPFTVLEGADKSCLAAFAALSSGSVSSSTSSRSNTAASPSGSVAAANGGSSSSGGAPLGAIVGAVVGVLVGLALLGLLAFCLIRRKRRRAAEGDFGGERRESEKTYVGGGGAKRSIARPQRLPSEPATSPPPSQASHDTHPTSATAFAAAYASTRSQSQRESISSTSSPYGKSPNSDVDPFATPGIVSPHHQSNAPTPPARPESGLELDAARRRASSPVPAFTGPFSPYTPGGPAYPAPAAGQPLSRSVSGSDGKRPSPTGSTVEMARRGSMKRKAVPSLGPELRKQMERGGAGGRGGTAGGAEGMGGRKQFALMPDMPGAAAAR